MQRSRAILAGLFFAAAVGISGCGQKAADCDDGAVVAELTGEEQRFFKDVIEEHFVLSGIEEVGLNAAGNIRECRARVTDTITLKDDLSRLMVYLGEDGNASTMAERSLAVMYVMKLSMFGLEKRGDSRSRSGEIAYSVRLEADGRRSVRVEKGL